MSLDGAPNDGSTDEKDQVLHVQNIAGGSGPDTLSGSGEPNQLDGREGDDTLNGLAAADQVDGGDGDDHAQLGPGNDAFNWQPGDGNDVVEGGGDTDTVAFDGDDVGEHFDLSANGSRVRLSRDVAAIAMDLDDVESVRVRALGGADAITQHDLSGTDLVEVTADLSASDGVSGDGQPDTVTVEGTNGDDVPRVVGDVNGVAVVGLAARMNVQHSEAANDALHVNALAGDDVLDGSSLLAGALTLTGDGGDGDDVLIGSAGADILLGQAGDDILFGGPGVDALDGGPGSNVVIQD